MSLYSTFATDKTTETSGTWIDYGDARIKIARAGGSNRAYAKRLTAKTASKRRAIEAGALSDEAAQEIMVDVYAHTVVLDWETRVGDDLRRGIENPDGGDLLPVDPDSIQATFRNLPDLFADIQAQAQRIGNFRAADLQDQAGN